MNRWTNRFAPLPYHIGKSSCSSVASEIEEEFYRNAALSGRQFGFVYLVDHHTMVWRDSGASFCRYETGLSMRPSNASTSRITHHQPFQYTFHLTTSVSAARRNRSALVLMVHCRLNSGIFEKMVATTFSFEIVAVDDDRRFPRLSRNTFVACKILSARVVLPAGFNVSNDCWHAGEYSYGGLPVRKFTTRFTSCFSPRLRSGRKWIYRSISVPTSFIFLPKLFQFQSADDGLRLWDSPSDDLSVPAQWSLWHVTENRSLSLWPGFGQSMRPSASMCGTDLELTLINWSVKPTCSLSGKFFTRAAICSFNLSASFFPNLRIFETLVFLIGV